MKQIIQTHEAPQAIGTYSQAVKVGNHVYISGQIPLDPHSMELVTGDIKVQIRQSFDNLMAIAKAAGGSLADIVKLTIYMCDLSHFAAVNEIMPEYFAAPYPARAVIGVSALPKNAQFEVDGIMKLRDL
jgi:reactive intermediate/imine deaminase